MTKSLAAAGATSNILVNDNHQLVQTVIVTADPVVVGLSNKFVLQ